MARHGVLLAAFLMQPDRPAGTAGPQILDLHLQSRSDAGKRVGQRRDQRAITLSCVNWTF
jgi:hypothetical protein